MQIPIAGAAGAALATLAALLPTAAPAQASRGALARGSFALTNVTVIPMTGDTFLPGATLLVRDGRIAAVGPGRGVTIPAGTRRIDGRGKYVIPGLADMHTAAGWRRWSWTR